MSWRLLRRRPAPALVRSQADPEAFVEVHDEHAGALLRHFALRVADQQTALDLVGETLATAYEQRATFRGRTAEEASAWIWAIARNKLKHHYRRRDVDRGALARIGVPRPLVTDEDLERIDELLTSEAASGALGAALDELPSSQRDVILLRYVDELSDQDIASSLSVTPEVVRARASRGLRRLRSDPELEALVDEDPA